MGSTRRSYTQEYKAHSVAFVIDGGRSDVAERAERSRGRRQSDLAHSAQRLRLRVVQMAVCTRGHVGILLN